MRVCGALSEQSLREFIAQAGQERIFTPKSEWPLMTLLAINVTFMTLFQINSRRMKLPNRQQTYQISELRSCLNLQAFW